MKASDVIAEFLQEKGIRHVFGIIGSGNAHLFDSIARRGFTQMVCVHHEQAAIMAMQAYFRITGKVGACVVTTGAGSANAVTGVLSAWMDSIPGLVLSGNENSRFTTEANPLRIWGIQGYDSTAMVSKITKYQKRVTEPEKVLEELERAYFISGSGRPGPVWLDIPMNIQAAPVDEAKLSHWDRVLPAAGADESLQGLLTDPEKTAHDVLDALRKAERPVLWLGQGIRLAGAVDLIAPLLERLPIPVLVSWAGIDMIDSRHPLVFGRAGIYGQRAANFVLQNCDFLLTIGTRLAVPQVGYELSEFARAAQIASVDIDPREVRKHGAKINFPICMDAKQFIEAVLVEAGSSSRGPIFENRSKNKDWLKRCEGYREKYPVIGPEHPDRDGFINSYPFMEKLESYLHADEIITTDMGTALLSGHQVLKPGPHQRLMTSTGLGEMGYGLPSALGAAIAAPGRDVLCLNCDGGMMMNLQELQTIVHHQLPIKIIVFNNDGYLMIKHTQKALFKGNYTGTDTKSGVTCPDYSKIATAFGMPSFRIRTWEDMETVMPQVMDAKGPVICEVFMHPEQLFLPKLSLAPRKDGSIVSPPIEDLAPLLPRDELREAMIIGLHPKSELL